MPPARASRELAVGQPGNGRILYRYETLGGIGRITRNGEALTTEDVNVTAFAFCVSGAGPDDMQTRVTIPLTLESTDGRQDTHAATSLQTTVVSRDLSVDLTQ